MKMLKEFELFPGLSKLKENYAHIYTYFWNHLRITCTHLFIYLFVYQCTFPEKKSIFLEPQYNSNFSVFTLMYSLNFSFVISPINVL